MLGVPSDRQVTAFSKRLRGPAGASRPIVWARSCPTEDLDTNGTDPQTVMMSPWRRSTTSGARRASSGASIVDRSSSPDEGAADGQHRKDPTDQPADAGRTPCHVDSGRRSRCLDRSGGSRVGDDGPLVGLWPIGRQLRKCHDREFDGRRSRARMWCRSTRLVSRCLRSARRPLGSSSGSVSNRGDSAVADNAGKLPRPVLPQKSRINAQSSDRNPTAGQSAHSRVAPRQRPKGGPA